VEGVRRQSAARRLWCLGTDGDAGLTLAEVLVAMGVMSVVMAMATTAILQMYRTSNRADVLWGNMTQLQTAFLQLDRSVRYATAISQPNTTATVGGDWYVEWSSVSGTTTMCSQLRLDGPSGLLQRRSELAGGQVSGWGTVASSLVASPPFLLQAASTSSYPHQRLTIDVSVRSAAGSSQPARRSTFGFTALNTSMMTVSSGVCTDMSRP
jgi:prepilin-type N-terminal cleavage/methylation domain-containing protein